jgi:hypothetical protein
MVGLTKRSILEGLESKVTTDGTYSIRRILSPSDEWSDFTDDEVEFLVAESIDAWKRGDGGKTEPKVPSGRIVRHHRAPQKGLLVLYPLEPVTPEQVDKAAERGVTLTDQPILGFAVSFPDSERAEKVEYTANRVYLEELFSMTDDGDDEE